MGVSKGRKKNENAKAGAKFHAWFFSVDGQVMATWELRIGLYDEGQATFRELQIQLTARNIFQHSTTYTVSPVKQTHSFATLRKRWLYNPPSVDHTCIQANYAAVKTTCAFCGYSRISLIQVWPGLDVYKKCPLRKIIMFLVKKNVLNVKCIVS